MKRIFTIGESLVDIIFQGGQPKAAKPGGAMLNTAVSLGRIKLPVSFISEFGKDDPGDLIDAFLKTNGVNTAMVNRYSYGTTPLALAFLDANNNANYTFYKDYPDKRLEISSFTPAKNDIILFGSFYAIDNQIRPQLLGILKKAKENGAIIIYDPNFRKSHLNELDNLKPLIIENMQMAAIVRGSDEDFRNIFDDLDPDSAWDNVSRFSKSLIYTSSTEGVYVRTGVFSGKFPVKKIEPVSTIGAGDNFNAGVISALYRENISRDQIENLGVDQWEKIVAAGVDFATNVCMSYDNYIDLAFASKYLSATGLQI
jgi:fructokinase